jgi:hypothetical protein
MSMLAALQNVFWTYTVTPELMTLAANIIGHDRAPTSKERATISELSQTLLNTFNGAGKVIADYKAAELLEINMPELLATFLPPKDNTELQYQKLLEYLQDGPLAVKWSRDQKDTKAKCIEFLEKAQAILDLNLGY